MHSRAPPQVKPVAVTDIAARREVWNFLLPRAAEGDNAYEAAAAARREELLPAARRLAAAKAAAVTTSGPAPCTDAGADCGPSAQAAYAAQAAGAVARPSVADEGQEPGGDGGTLPIDVVDALVRGQPLAADQLMYGDLEVTTPERKRAQAALLARVARDAKSGCAAAGCTRSLAAGAQRSNVPGAMHGGVLRPAGACALQARSRCMLRAVHRES